MPITSASGSFSNQVKAIVTHYKSTPGQAYPLPALASDRSLGPNDIQDKPEVKAWLTATEASMKATSDAAQARITEAFEQYGKDKDKEALKKKIEVIKDDTKEMGGKVIDFSASLVESLGEKHPEWQDALLDLFDKCTNFITVSFEESKSLIQKVIETIIGAFEIVDVVSSIKKFFKDLGGKVSKFFSKPSAA